MDYNKLAKKIFEQNKEAGWWDDLDRCVFQTLQLVNTEISEATEGERKNLMDDHLTQRKMGEVELADALIRILDLGGRYGWEYNNISSNANISALPMLNAIKSIAGRHLVISIALAYLAIFIFHNKNNLGKKEKEHFDLYYSVIIHCILTISKQEGYDVDAAMLEKIEYNKKRSDHKRENREKKNGKKW